MAKDRGALGRPGEGVDSRGGPVVDPTKNVLDLVGAAVDRLDDLRDMEAKHFRELLELRAAHYEDLRRAEASRIDAIRAVDAQNVARAAEVATAQAAVLAQQLTANAEQARAQVFTALEPVMKDIQDLRKAQYEAQGGRTQIGDTRLSMGSILGAVSVALVLVFGIASLAIAIILR